MILRFETPRYPKLALKVNFYRRLPIYSLSADGRLFRNGIREELLNTPNLGVIEILKTHNHSLRLSPVSMTQCATNLWDTT